MKAKFLFIIFIISFVGIIAQQKESIKFQAADESGFIEVDKAPALISQLKLVYPELAKLAGIEGKVFLKVLIDEKGNVAKAKVEKGVKDMLDEAALTAVKEAKFSPAMIKGKPIEVWVVLPIAFKLDTNKKDVPRSKIDISSPSIVDLTKDVKIDKYPEIVTPAMPVYPEDAKKSGIEGKVFVKLLIDKEGYPRGADVVKSDNEIFNQSAIDAAMKTKFSPAVNNGEAIIVWIVLPYRFALDGVKKEEKK